jgi:hypothetical protein
LSDPQVIWSPQPGPQTLLIQCPVFEVFYGGARGGGKTDGSIGDWLLHAATYGEHAVGIFVRRKLTQLAEVIARTKILFKKLNATYNEQKKEWLMPNGARLKFVYLERDSDAENYQGHNYTRVYIEEATNFPDPAPIQKLKATLRSAAGVPCGIRLTGNPGGPGHSWVKARYIDNGPFKVVRETEDVPMPDGTTVVAEIERVFIPAKLTDNRLLLQNDPSYILRLRQSGSPALVKAWLEGLWNEIEGAYFAEYDEDKHVVFGELVIPSWWLRFRAMDWGSAKPFSIGWYAVSDGKALPGGQLFPRGALVKYREWYGMTEKPNQGLKLPANLVARGVLIREAGERITYGVADPSIFANNGGPSIAEMMIVEGCSWLRADNARQAGWEQVRKRLEPDPAQLYIHESCIHTRRTFPLVQHCEKNPEDLDTETEDHALDETRYAVMSRQWVTDESIPSTGAMNVSMPTINQLLARQAAKARAGAY